jgi:hypothetical protein
MVKEVVARRLQPRRSAHVEACNVGAEAAHLRNTREQNSNFSVPDQYWAWEVINRWDMAAS